MTLGSGALIRARRTLLSFCDVLVVFVRNPDGSRRRKSLLEVRSAGDGVRPSDWGSPTLLNNQDIFVLSALGHTHVLIAPSLHVKQLFLQMKHLFAVAKNLVLRLLRRRFELIRVAA